MGHGEEATKNVGTPDGDGAMLLLGQLQATRRRQLMNTWPRAFFRQGVMRSRSTAIPAGIFCIQARYLLPCYVTPLLRYPLTRHFYDEAQPRDKPRRNKDVSSEQSDRFLMFALSLRCGLSRQSRHILKVAFSRADPLT